MISSRSIQVVFVALCVVGSEAIGSDLGDLQVGLRDVETVFRSHPGSDDLTPLQPRYKRQTELIPCSQASPAIRYALQLGYEAIDDGNLRRARAAGYIACKIMGRCHGIVPRTCCTTMGYCRGGRSSDYERPVFDQDTVKSYPR